MTVIIKWALNEYTSYATGDKSLTSLYLLHTYIYCTHCRLCIINGGGGNSSVLAAEPWSRLSLQHFPPYRCRAIAQAVSRWLPTVAVRVRAQTRMRFVVDKVVLGQPILIPLNSPYSSLIRGWYNRPISGRRNEWTQSHATKLVHVFPDQVCLLWFAGAETETLPYFSVRLGSAAQETVHPDLQETSGSRLQGLSSQGAPPWQDKEEGEGSFHNIPVGRQWTCCGVPSYDVVSPSAWFPMFQRNNSPKCW
jgi:hypothetical protein